MTINDGEFLLKSSTRKLRRKPEGIWLILTHNHSDHIFGMDVFKKNNAKVVAHEWSATSSITGPFRLSSE
jgi:glyoxylase-like metal-dependent hydrolase (beta-lactamase superfamily II)